MPAKRTPQTKTVIDDFDPFLDSDELPEDDEAALSRTKNPISVELAELQGVPFTITDLAEEPQPAGSYQFFKWRLFLMSRRDNNNYTCLMNPSKKRNELFDRISKQLPLRTTMTFVQKQFNEPRSLKLVTYYDLVPYQPTSGTISH